MANKREFSDNTLIKECTCVSPYQDKIHGQSKRVMNPTKKEDGSKQLFRCTVCGRMHTK